MSWLRSKLANPSKGKQVATVATTPDGLPEWTAAPEASHTYGLVNEASDNDYDNAMLFFERNPEPRYAYPLPSAVIERIQEGEGCREWRIEIPRTPRFAGSIGTPEKGQPVCKISTTKKCKDTCLMSNLPISAGLYDVRGKPGVYYEVCVWKMGGVIAIGTACQPYPDFRFPGWHRLSVGLHLDDMRKFFDDSCGGMDYSPLLTKLHPGDTIGCGLDFIAQSVFFTYNGVRLPDAFGGVYVPRTAYNVYAAIGVEGHNEFEVNFGADVFRWKEGNEWGWRIDGQILRNQNAGGSSGGSGLGEEVAIDDELPSYQAAVGGALPRHRRY